MRPAISAAGELYKNLGIHQSDSNYSNHRKNPLPYFPGCIDTHRVPGLFYSFRCLLLIETAILKKMRFSVQLRHFEKIL